MSSSTRKSARIKQQPGALSSTEEDSHAEDTEIAPKFQVLQRVYARDVSSSLWYEAVIRRSLFGVNHNKQVQIGLVNSESEIEEILSRSEQPGWAYFCHYLKWNTNWDRWVTEDDVMELNEESKRIADRYVEEHKKLQREMKQNRGKQDGIKFLTAWSKRMEKIEEELKSEREGKSVDSKATNNKEEQKAKTSKAKAVPVKTNAKQAKKKNPADKWDKAAIEREYRLRLRGLEGKRSSAEQHKLSLPFSLKKVMVEAWEIITQCQMVPNLPSSFTVKQGLDQYLQSKLELVDASSKPKTVDKKTEEKKAEDKKAEDKKADEADKHSVDQVDESKSDPAEGEKLSEEEQKLQSRRKEWNDMVQGILMLFDEALPFRLLYSQELCQFRVVENTLMVKTNDGDNKEAKNEDIKMGDTIKKEIEKDDIKMEDAGSPIAGSNSPLQITEDKGEKTPEEMKASPKQEVLQGDTDKPTSPTEKSEEKEEEPKSNEKGKRKEKQDKLKNRIPPSEIYGCEYLLRLCLKIPELLAEQQPTPSTDDEAGMEALRAYEQESKQILAKVNDLIRFLHKHQSTMFADSYRKKNEAELRDEVRWMRRKRKRALEDKPDTPVSTTNASPGGDNSSVPEPQRAELITPTAKAQKVD